MKEEEVLTVKRKGTKKWTREAKLRQSTDEKERKDGKRLWHE